MQNLKIEKGEVIVLTEGEYSSFRIDGFIVSIEAFDMAQMAQEFAATRKLESWQDSSDRSDYDGFVAWLIGKELVIPVKYRDIHLGNYHGFAKDFGLPDYE